MKKFYLFLLCLCMANALYSQVLQHKVAVVYVVPSDVTFNPAVLDTLKIMTAEMQNWYQLATGGRTFEMLYPDTVIVYHAQQPRQYYKDSGDWWGSLLTELQTSGAAPIWTPGYITAIWAHSAGWWAGGAQGCGKDCGTVLLGVELLAKFNNPLYSGGVCPGGSGVGAWPCTPQGAYFHELGHALGLPHPNDIPATRPVAGHSIMQTHWNYPDFAPPFESPWGLLSLERQTLAQNPFMKLNIGLVQFIERADVVNLPVTGTIPRTDFSFTVVGNEVRFNNNSSGATSYYWTFGDKSVSNLSSPVHIYQAPGTYKVTLRANSAVQMMGIDSATITVGQSQQQVIQSFTLIDAVTDTDIMTLVDGAVIDLNIIGTDKINIRANTSSPAVVKFRLRGEERETRIDDVSPYALKGDDRNGNYYSWTPDKGRYTLTATPHAGTKKHLGAPTGTAYTIRFRVTRSKHHHAIASASNQEKPYTEWSNEVNQFSRAAREGDPVFDDQPNPGFERNSVSLNDYWRMGQDSKGNYFCSKISENYSLGSASEVLKQNQSDRQEAQQMLVYPNPTPDGKIQIQIGDQLEGPVHFRLYSGVGATLANGTLELKDETERLEFDFSTQIHAAGAYYLLLQGANTYRLFKVIRN